MTTDLTPEHTARHPDSDSYSEVIAAYQYVQSVIPTADVQSSAGGYAWHGWALREAFLAGCTHARAALADEPAVLEGREPGTWTEGVCGDGAALLKDGVMVPIEAVVRELNEGARARAALANEPAVPSALVDTHYEWELEDAAGEWQAGGSSNSQSDVEREGMHYLQTYAQDGPHKLIIRQHTTQTINEIANDH